MEFENPETEEEHCRICRCGSEEGELFNPCLCRGSVKYVHSDCLKQWLSSSKRERRCDICKTQYRFRPLIPEDAPEELSVFIILKELTILSLKNFLKKYAGLVLSAILFGVVYPMIVVWAVRVFSVLLDGQMPKDTLVRSILAGSLDELAPSFEFSRHNLWRAIKYSYPTGLKIVVIVVVTTLQWTILHEWVTRDQGFTELIKLKVGDETVSNYVDAFIRSFLQECFRPDSVNGRISRQELERLIELHELSFRTQARNIAFIDASDEQLEREYEKVRTAALEKIREVIPFVDNLVPANEENLNEAVVIPDLNLFQAPDIPQLNLAHQQDVAGEIFGLPDDEDEEDMGGLGLGFNFQIEMEGGLKIFAIAVVLTVAALGVTYYPPSVFGKIIVEMACLAVVFIRRSVEHYTWIQRLYELLPQVFIRAVTKYTTPWVNEVIAVCHGAYPVSMTGRMIPYIADLAVAFSINTVLMYVLENSFRTKLIPLKGIKRRVYYHCFHFRSVLKVNVIFATEIIVFPVFCGLLLDFISSPLFLQDTNFISRDKLFTSSLFYDFFKNDKSLMFVSYWSAGTIYMCLFATYVGMIRKYILRPGVLFFIRSPDDQNSRLVHDALVRPFGLQMSRIFLSGAVYTAFILVGFGVIVFPLRYYTHLIPLKFNLVSTFSLSSAYVLYFKLYKILVPPLRKYVRIYWLYAIRQASKATRMSSFILGIDDVRERGKVVYRSWYDMFFDRHEPDYDVPVDENQLDEFFASNPDAKSAFVPDGNWIRAPDNDNVSRLYLRYLFYPVRADGTDFEDYKPSRSRGKIDNLLGEKDEVDDIRSHRIIFRPPNFGIRNFMFVTLLWFFATILIMGVVVSANLVGSPVSFLISKSHWNLPDWTLNLAGLGYFSDHSRDHFWQLSYSSLVFGITILLAALKKLDRIVKVNKIQALKQGKPFFEGLREHPDAEERAEYDEMATLLVNYAGKFIDGLKRVYEASLWILFSIIIHKYLVGALLDPDGLAPSKIRSDLLYYKSLDYSRLAPLIDLLTKEATGAVSRVSFGFVCAQVMVSALTFLPLLVSVSRGSKQLFLKHFHMFVRPQLLAVVELSLYSLYKVGSIWPGLMGELGSTPWESCFGLALIHCASSWGRELYHILMGKNDEIRRLYYATGEELMNYGEEEERYDED